MPIEDVRLTYLYYKDDIPDKRFIIKDYDDIVAQKADLNGAYPLLSAGAVLGNGRGDSEPYLFRRASGVGLRDKLVGGTVAWNQLVKKGDFPSDFSSNWSATNGSASASDGVCTLTPSAQYGRINQYFTYAPNHKLLIEADLKLSNSSNASSVMVSAYGVDLRAANTQSASATTDWQHVAVICYATSASPGSNRFMVTDARTSDWGTIQVKNYKAHDLTLMFGSTIADYIYTLEQGTAGAGVAFFRALFPKPYYAYDAGSLLSVKASGHDSVGFNQWDEEWEVGRYDQVTGLPVENSAAIRSLPSKPIHVQPNTIYYYNLGSSGGYVLYYKADGSFIHAVQMPNSGTYTTPSECYLVRFYMYSAYGTTYNHDISVNLPSTETAYHPYQKVSYPFSDIELRGIVKLVSNKLQYDGDTYESDGTVTRRYGVVDLGTLTWERVTSGTYPFFRADLSGALYKNNTAQTIVPTKYTAIVNRPQSSFGGSDNDGKICILNSQSVAFVAIMDSAYSDATAFKTSLNGISLAYELETPTTETADPYAEVQTILSTEAYVDDRTLPMPVGHDSTYYADAVPPAPSTDGTYTLKVTVSGGVASYSWEA